MRVCWAISVLLNPSLKCAGLSRLSFQVTRLEDFKTPGADLEGVYYLRKVADADALLEGIAEAKKKGPDVNVRAVGAGRIWETGWFIVGIKSGVVDWSLETRLCVCIILSASYSGSGMLGLDRSYSSCTMTSSLPG